MSQFTLRFQPLNPRQRLAVTKFAESDILFCLGEAGSGKTFLSIALALRELQARELERIYITRPIGGAGEELGSLPGDVDEKYAPFMLPVADTLNQLVEDPKERRAASKLFIPAPLAYMRGRTFTNSIAILDEGQNATRTQLKLFLTRLGNNSKLIITGDPHQTDIGSRSGLLEVAQTLRGIPRIGIIYFEADDCVRHPLVSEILKRL